MVCGHCGGQVPASAGACPRCRTPIGSATATGVLTPPGGFELPDEAEAPTFAGAFGPGPDRTPDFADDAPTLSGGSAPDPASTEAPTIGALPTMLSASSANDDLATLATGAGAPALSVPGDTGPLAPGHQFGPRYHIIRLLGIGGMGAVYQAWDAELGVAVAIKVIRPEVMSDPAAATEVERRFKRELLLARQVTHKNVVRIHDLGEIEGIKYITMPYVDGADLSSIVKKEGRLPIPKTLRIARSIVAGLVAAHKAGVVHRDLKPANIMVGADGEAMVMDFGIARSAGGPSDNERRDQSGRPIRPPRIADATMVGTIVGTVEYMAPEQAKGQAVDQRADLYAFGLILYDVLAGRRRVEKPEGAIPELQARMEKAPPPIKTAVPDVPDAVATIVSRCLEPDPAARYQTTEELAGVLDRLDENGIPIPIRRVVGLPLMTAIVLGLLALSGATWWYTRQAVPPAPHDPVSVLIADFQNGSSDPAFNRTLEPLLKRALEGAGFITAYDRTGVNALGVQAPEQLDEGAARELAAKQGVGVVLTGRLTPQGSGYEISIKAIQTVTGAVIADARRRAASKDQVPGVATNLASTVRTALGDDASDSAQMFAMASLSATSLDVLSAYAAGREASSAGKFDEAKRSYAKAVELDPKFGIGYQSLATLSMNLGNAQDAERYFKEALGHLDGMTERERFNTRGMYYRTMGDYPQCVKEYTDLIARFAADVQAHNNLALCSTFLRDLPTALNEMQRAVEILPKRALYRINLALYASYAGDFQTGEKEARSAQELGSPLSLLPLAFAQLGQDQLQQVTATYQELGNVGSLGAIAPSYRSSGLGDVAIYEGRYADAVRILNEGVTADLAAKNPDRAAAKLASIAYAELSRGRKAAAVAATTKALEHSQAVKIRFLAARTLVEADQVAKAKPLIDGLAAEILAEPQAYAKIVEGDVFLRDANYRQAIAAFTEANKLLDTWIGHLDLGRAYLGARQFPQADSEFDRAMKRRGEALSLFLDEEPTSGYFPQVYYYQGRVRQELNNAGFAESYRKYLGLRAGSTDDLLAADARRRAGVS